MLQYCAAKVMNSVSMKTTVMRIKRVTYQEMVIPLKQPYRLSHSTITNLETIIVKIETENTIGIGEATIIPIYSNETIDIVKKVIDEIMPHLKGKRITDIEDINKLFKYKVPKSHLAKSAIECAIYDALGKELKLPLYDIIGGRVRDKIELVGTIGICSIEQAVNLASHFIKKGFQTLKIKVGRDIEEDIRRITAIRDLDENIKLRIDANEAYTFDEALKMANILEEIGVELFEQPLPRDRINELKKLREYINIPIMVDESVYTIKDLINIIENNAADMVKLKVMKSGITDTKVIATIAEEFDISCIIGNGVQTEVGALTEVHIAVSTPNINPICECVGPLKIKKFITKEGFRIKGAVVEIPNNPGIGLTLIN